MGIPIWSAGEVLSASDVNEWFVPLNVVKPAATSRSSTTTVANDPDLSLAVEANQTYQFDFFVSYHGGTQGSSDLKWQWAGPSGAHLNATYFSIGPGGGGIVGNTSFDVSQSQTTGTDGAAQSMGMYQTGVLVVSSVAGSLTFKWAQNSSNSTATVIEANSYLTLRRIA